ncbi:NAD(P)-dependent glycerol-3-phosphate dehydrogenase [Actinomyces sp. 594]|uniref:NAD(P)H-dependent glycerol-3-phosphate dehydrogenase n=1 Tax=Actinomyces sp. 594 TaxID=2057793 RepID=UPI001C59F7E3|nr:NAD(P)H-dependent glycerol-3-phosphate dehydrogenase [Actinomyces sp. 594]MBW3068291.1 NAD(P)-dependent glycerol-3-phosphate dehydrogenase [Actinomyces sp. 594]
MSPVSVDKAAVIGAGAWGTTFAGLLAQAGAPTVIWARRPEVAEEINAGTNARYLPGVRLPDIVTATTDIREAVAGAGLVVVVVPSQTARGVLTPLRGCLDDDATVVSLMKGVEAGTGLRMSQVIAEALALPAGRIAVVSGPNLADEIAAGQPTATVVAAQDEAVAARVAALCATGTFRPYTNTDVLGVELCGAVKNVIALAVGITAGRGFGDNSKATVITRGLVEITRLGLALGASPETFAGLAGMGDLVATCSSPLSRNQTFGRRLGEGMSVEEAAAASRGVAEGAKSARAVLDLATAHGVDMPITAGVVAVVEGAATVEEISDALLSRPRKAEGVNAAPLT